MVDLALIRFAEILPGSVEYAAALVLREEVLRRPLGLSFTPEEMAKEPGCVHLVGLLRGEVVATLLLEPLDAATVLMRQVAVRPALHDGGIGGRLLVAAEAAARVRGFTRLMAHARAAALAFYERNGYAAEGEFFIQATIAHQTVAKAL